MNQSFYIGAVGASQQMKRLNIQGNNIANVNTYGFKAEKARFTSLIYENMAGIDAEQPSGVGTRILMTSTDHNQRGVADTGRSLDYMIEGHGFFALVNLDTGEVSYTRDGSFTMAEFMKDTGEVDENGEPVLEKVFCLSDGDGRFVLGERGALIEVTDPKEELPIGIFDFANYDGMRHLSANRFMNIEKNGRLVVGDGILRQGMLEQSNVDLAEEITKVIEAQRAYGLALKMVQTSDEIETTINGLRS